MANKRPALTEQTRARLKASFWDLYMRKDINKIHVKDITESAGYNRATFYEYFHDIPDLFTQAEDELLDTIAALITTHLEDLASGDFKSGIEFLVSTVQKHRGVISVLLSDRGDPKFVRKIKNLIVPLVDQGADHLKLNEAESKIFHEFTLAGILSAVTVWLSDDGAMSITDFVQFLSESCAPQIALAAARR
jgi:AcrR family transcriptional regulator